MEFLRSSPGKFTTTELMGFSCLPESCHLISLQGLLGTRLLPSIARNVSISGTSQACSRNGMISLVILLHHYPTVTHTSFNTVAIFKSETDGEWRESCCVSSFYLCLGFLTKETRDLYIAWNKNRLDNGIKSNQLFALIDVLK